MLKVEKAREELREKSYLEIQKQTAITWASRAAASYELAMEEKDKLQKFAIYQVAEEYHHEAIEHAALYEDRGELLKELEKELDKYRNKAADDLKDSLKS